jgi:hypothetical protein
MNMVLPLLSEVFPPVAAGKKLADGTVMTANYAQIVMLVPAIVPKPWQLAKVGDRQG